MRKLSMERDVPCRSITIYSEDKLPVAWSNSVAGEKESNALMQICLPDSVLVYIFNHINWIQRGE